jgi:hypothetical protein
MPHPVSIAFWTYVTPMVATRAFRVGLLAFLGFVGLIVVLFTGGFLASWFTTHALVGVRHFLITVGLPIGAILLSEMALRDGISQRTLLYPLLGPVDRATLAVVRTLVSGLLLGVSIALLLVLIRVLLKDSGEFLFREAGAVLLGALAFTGLFGLFHLVGRRALIAALAYLFILDVPLGQIPLNLRTVSLSYHVGVISNQQEDMALNFGGLNLALPGPEPSVSLAVVVLVAVTIATVAFTAWAFRRKSLGELC